MARPNQHRSASEAAARTSNSPQNLEELARKAIGEHRRLAAIADAAYADWEEAENIRHLSEEALTELRHRYALAMLAMRLQQEELNSIINQLGCVPKNIS